MADAATRAVAELVGGSLPIVAAISIVGAGPLEDGFTSTAAAAALRAELPRRFAAQPSRLDPLLATISVGTGRADHVE